MRVIAPVEGFGKKCQHLAQFPYLGRSYSQLAPGLRGVPLMGYIIFYQIVEDEDKIEILRIISGYRNLNNIFTRRLNRRSVIALSLPVCTNSCSKARSPKIHLHFESGRVLLKPYHKHQS